MGIATMYAIHIDKLNFDPEKLEFSLDLVDDDKYDLTSELARGRDIQVVGRKRTLTFYHERSKDLYLNGMQLFNVTYRVSPNQIEQSYTINFKIRWGVEARSWPHG